MKKWLDTYFGFTRREFNGLITLVVLIALTMFFPYLYSLIKQEEPVTEAEQQAVLELVLAEQQKISSRGRNRQHLKHSNKHKAELFIFDPNTLNQEGWEKLGLSAKQASSIIKYTAKGGRFKKVEDLKKMYALSEGTYGMLAPYVKIASVGIAESSPKTYVKQHYENKAVVKIEINDADTLELDKVKGIGITFANRIIKYRDRIGGFYKKEQLMEVFGLDSVKYNEIKDQILVDASRLKKININTASFEDFKNHPYIRYKQVNALIAYRKQHGNYGNIADLNKVAILDQETINRLAAYLEF